MDQVLGRTAGNALEVRESLDVLRDGTGEPRLVEVTLALARAALELAGLDADPQAGADLRRRGRALRRAWSTRSAARSAICPRRRSAARSPAAAS